MRDRIRIVLVNITHPGNIGAAARAMKTMGFDRLALVSPGGFPSAEATARAAGADDVLASAAVFGSLKEAVSDCGLVYGTSARLRGIPWPVLDPAEAARNVARQVGEGATAAVVFGPERSGLSNTDLESCNGVIRIPTDPEFSSLNVAAAVQVICYELQSCRTDGPGNRPGTTADTRLATAAEREQFYEQLEQTMIEIGFMDPQRPRRLMHRLRRLFNRAQLDMNEYNILRGILAAVRKTHHEDHEGHEDEDG